MKDLKILVIDDEPGMRTGIERTLDGAQMEFFENDVVQVSVDSAANGKDGLEKLKNNTFDILFLDYKLPDITGIEIIEELGDRAKDLIIIMITAYASIEVAVDATRKGAYDFLPKPFTPGELKSVTRKAAERILLARKNAQLAEEKKQVRFEFIRVLGHELKAPLGAVEGYLELVRSKALGESIADYEKIVDRSLVRLQQMRKLIEDLLDMTKIESGKKDRDLVELDLKVAAERAIELAKPSADARNIKIDLQSPDSMTMLADVGEIDMMLNNLVSNAVKYNRDSGKITIKLASDEHNIIISVSDTGIGMSEEEQKRLFKEFSRIRNAKTADIPGSGLGLSILKRLVDLYEGKIEVQSVPDVGTTFILKFPVKK
ncbi:MAG: response regulator [Candidatus Rifleibacteriota bacterium]